MGIATLKKQFPQLKILKVAKPKQRKELLTQANSELITCICECALNILNGNVQITKTQHKKLSRHAKTLRTIAQRGVSNKKKKDIVIQKGGFLPALLAPISTLVASLIRK